MGERKREGGGREAGVYMGVRCGEIDVAPSAEVRARCPHPYLICAPLPLFYLQFYSQLRRDEMRECVLGGRRSRRRES
jgi:hypothetical protein